jgi:hypothetical protein
MVTTTKQNKNQKTSFSTIGPLSKLQECVLLHSVGLIGQMELLLLQKKTLEARSSLDRHFYGEMVRSDDFKERFIPDNVLKDLRYGDQKETLKDETVKWIIKYTNDMSSAVSIVCIAVNEMKYLKKRIRHYYNTTDDGNMPDKDTNFSKKKRRHMASDLKSILQNTNYEELYDMLIDAHFIATKKGKSLVHDCLTDEDHVENKPNKDGECEQSDILEAPVAVKNKPNDDSVPHGGMKNDETEIVQKIKKDGECQESDVIEALVAVKNKPNDDIMAHGLMKVDHNVIVQQIKKDVYVIDKEGGPDTDVVDKESVPETDVVDKEGAPDTDVVDKESVPDSDVIDEEGGPNTDVVDKDSGPDSDVVDKERGPAATAMVGQRHSLGSECLLLIEELKNIPEDHIKSFFLKQNRKI